MGKLEPVSARCWIPADLGVESFFFKLRDLDVSYVVLRWFENLPEMQAGEDIDFLVADEDVSKFLNLLDRRNKSGIPVDIYTPSGIHNTLWNQVAYFPNQMSNAILESRAENSRGISVPNHYWHAVSLAYHVVYHKGYDSGLASSSGTVRTSGHVDHDYDQAIRSAMDKIGVKLRTTNLDELEDFIREQGCQPPFHLEEFISRRNEFVHESLTKRLRCKDEFFHSLAVFMVREKAKERVGEIREILINDGFEVVIDAALDSDEVERVVPLSRGGNWGRGPFAKSGGKPSHVFVTLDVFPQPPRETDLEAELFIGNRRVSVTKEKIRQSIWDSLSYIDRFNPLHSIDNGLGVKEFLIGLFGIETWRETLEKARSELQKIQASIPADGEQISSHSRRAQLYRFGRDREFVRKIFRPQFHDFLLREIQAREILGDIPLIVGLVRAGANYIDMPFVSGGIKPTRATSRQIEELRAFINTCAERKIQPLDFTPENLLQDESGHLRFLDLEFFQKVDRAYLPFNSSSIRSLPNHSKLIRPAPRRYQRTFYLHHWLRFTNLPRVAFIGHVPRFLIPVAQSYATLVIWFLDRGPGIYRLLRLLVSTKNAVRAKLVSGSRVIQYLFESWAYRLGRANSAPVVAGLHKVERRVKS